MLENLSKQLEILLISLVQNAKFSLFIVMSLWLIHGFNWLTGYTFNHWGIATRKLRGLPGIFFAPFLHADFNHLFFNSIPLFGLLDLLLSRGLFLLVYLSCWVVSIGGLAIWLLAKSGIHIGASALIMGYFGYLIAETCFYRTTQGMLLAVLVIYYFGGLFFSIIPQKKSISWEGHLFGLLSGISFAYWLYG